MSEPWFNPGWVGGVISGLFGAMVGIWGAVAGICLPRGKCQGLVYGWYYVNIFCSAVGLVAGITAAASGQPYGVYYPLLMVGGFGLFVLLPLGIVVRKRRIETEQRRMDARDL